MNPVNHAPEPLHVRGTRWIALAVLSAIIAGMFEPIGNTVHDAFTRIELSECFGWCPSVTPPPAVDEPPVTPPPAEPAPAPRAERPYSPDPPWMEAWKY